MSESKKITIVVPFLNEKDNLPVLLERVRECLPPRRRRTGSCCWWTTVRRTARRNGRWSRPGRGPPCAEW